jgi:DNA-binding NarL/FixJ family response regulator
MQPAILIADDHAGIREGLRHLLTDEFPAVRLGEAASGEEVLESCRKQRWDLVVLDLNMPPVFGLDVLERLKRTRKSPAVIILSLEPKSLYAAQARKLGAVEYLSKQDPPEDLVKAVRKVISPLLAGEVSRLVDGDGI